MAFDGKAHIDREKARLAAATARLTDEDREEIQARAEAARVREEAIEAERVARQLDLTRRFERAQAELGEGVRVAELIIHGHPHTFIVRDPGRAAYKQWEKDIGQVAMGKAKMQRDEVTRTFAAAAVHDWNGVTNFDELNPASKTTYGAELVALLTEFPAIATRIQNEATDLAGLAQEERKS